MKIWIPAIFLLLTALPLHAWHIVGGSMSYQFLGNDTYRIRLEIYRDCAQTNGAAFDNPTPIGIYDENNVLVLDLQVPYDESTNDTISLLPDNYVCEFPANICIHRAVYDTVVVLPPGAGKYTVTYQRCCRSLVIANLAAPETIGMTFIAEIDPDHPNSSPNFNQDIPLAIFANIAFLYDGSAADPDGDSLAYKLSTPLVGADQSIPLPNPPLPPPYFPVAFAAGYAEDNMLGGNYPLKIDPATGEFSAVAPSLGAFQIGYKVEEYRNGQLIGSTRREFLFVVTQPQPTLNFDVSGRVLVDSLTPLDAGTVQLLKRDIANDSLHLFSETSVDAAGNYAFANIPPGIFYLKALLDSTSAYFGNYLPTYYRSDLLWYEANTINQCDTNQFYRDIFLVHADSFAGGGDVFKLVGIVHWADAPADPVANLDLLLTDANGHFFRHAKTGSDGRFEFENVPPGDHAIFVDWWNSEVDNALPPVVSLAGDLTVNFLLHSDRLELTGVISGAAEREMAVPIAFGIQVFPNPSAGEVQVEMPNWSPGEKAEVRVADLLGNVLHREKAAGERVTLRLEELAAGVYFITLENERGAVSAKWVKK